MTLESSILKRRYGYKGEQITQEGGQIVDALLRNYDEYRIPFIVEGGDTTQYREDNNNIRQRDIDGVTKAIGETREIFVYEHTGNGISDSDNNAGAGEVYIVAHGWNAGFTDFLDIANYVKTAKPAARVLVIDWLQASETRGTAPIGGINSPNYKAVTWIGAIAQEFSRQLQQDFSTSSINFIGHSFGTLLSSETANVLPGKVNTITALDPPSEGDTINPLAAVVGGDIGGYDLYPNRSGRQGPQDYSAVSNYSRAYVGSRSIAGNQRLAATAHESFQMDFGIGIREPGQEHGWVVEVAKTFINPNHPRKLVENPFSSEEEKPNLFTLDDNQPHPQFAQDVPGLRGTDLLSRRNYVHQGVMVVNEPNEVQFLVAAKTDLTGTLVFGTNQDDNLSLSINTSKDLLRRVGDNTYYAGEGDDTVISDEGDDTLYGGEGNDSLDGYLGNDILYGGTGDDTLDAATLGNDTLIGVDPEEDTPGVNEIDTLKSGFGENTFVLGDEKNVYYSTKRNNDYALITDFNPGGNPIAALKGVDTIQLKGEASDYSLLPTPNGLPQGTGIYLSKPLDVFVLEDLSGSFEDDTSTLQSLVTDLVDNLREIEPDTNFGVGSFVDKPISPFGYPSDYVYRTNLPITENEKDFQSTINSLTIYNGSDYPESQLEALLQTALRADDEVGFREDSTRIVVLSTDANYHVAGNGSQAGITTPNNGDAILDGGGIGEDYPSIGQVANALRESNIIPIFAVTNNVTSTYQSLVSQLGVGTVVDLASDSSNLIDAITGGLDDIGGNRELIGIVEGAVDLSLEESYFSFVVNSFEGGDGDDSLEGGDGDDTLDGGGGSDTLDGGEGDDTYILDSLNDAVIENTSSGNDTIETSIDYSLADVSNVENLKLTGYALKGTGNSDNNQITGNFRDNTLDGKQGNDTLISSAGRDTLIGGKGDDTYVIYNTDNVIREYSNGGTDTVKASIDYSIASYLYVENLTLTGIALEGTGNYYNNQITGNAQDNTLSGGGGNDTLDGGTGNDSLIGGSGNDTYIVDSAKDTIVEISQNFNNGGNDTVFSSVNYSLAELSNVENLTLTGNALAATGNSHFNQITGNAQDNTLDSGSGNDTLDGGLGNDTLIGGTGNDTYIVDSANDTIVENQSEGLDKVFSSVDYSIASFADVEELTLTGNAINATGNSLDNRIRGNELNNVLNGGEGNDNIRGEDGNDTLISSAGRDTLYGGAGDDTYLINNTGNIISESSTGGNDTVKASIDYSISSLSYVENLILTGSALEGTGNYYNNQITGNAQDNTLNGGGGNDTLDGGTGNDSLIGGSGSDTYIVDSLDDTIVENYSSSDVDTVFSSVDYSLAQLNNLENLILTGSAINGTGNFGNNKIIGNAQDNILDGGSGNDTLDGSAGNDTLIGGTGNDTYIVDSADDTIVENQSEGFDKVFSSVDYSIANFAHVEDLTLTGNAINATGNSLNNRITGNELNNVLNGGEGNDYIRGEDGNDTLISSAGRDTLIGGAGDDIYLMDNTDNIISESSTGGTDTVEASIDYSISSFSYVENLRLTGSALEGTGNYRNNQITGNAQDNTLNGSSGNDTLDGGTGNDSLNGGSGNDTYIVDSVGDIIVEISSSYGTDTVEATIDYSLAQLSNVENLTLTGNALAGTGNSHFNQITGNAQDNTLDGGNGNDTLDGSAGNDTLIGGTGSDTYIVDSVGDTIVENQSEGFDKVFSSVDYSIANFAHVEDLTLTGNAINATGNSLNNRITGNELNNVLNGGEGNDYIRGEDGNDTLISSAGRDTLAGGKGDDTYLINNTGNIITESSNSGNDTVKATIDYSISSISHVENLVLTDTANQGTGNYRNNQITGNDQDNTLNGSSGNDTLDGGNGNDSLIGGSGNDNLDGSAGDDTLNGGTGNDTLNGGTGDDSLIGGTGNDTYIVDSHNDTIVENSSSGGTDTVEALISYSIANSNTSFVENLILTGNAINGTGNSRYNQITGNALDNSLDGGNGNDTLDGSAGNDTLIGGTGSDTYIVDSADDTIVENQSEGFDKVFSSVDYSITNFAHVEDLTLTGNAINATGNSLNNRITGNELNNVLNGGEGNDYIRGEDGNDTLISSAGRDTLAGGKGDDTYLINNTGNIITESSNSGNDTVKATIDYSISSISHVENLVLTDTANQGTGNSGNNQITGNAQDNTLNGGYGNDTLDGSTGNDSLIGSYGNDILLGGDGNDTLNGGSNNDILVGGIGNDELIGSSGKDIFVLNNPDEGIDEITDFSAVDDTIHISASGFGGGLTAGGTISEDQILIGSSLFSADSATQRFIYDTNSGTLLFDADGNQTGFDAVQIARLLSKPTITASDIFVTV